ncbi:MAG: urea ABC transporter permease subunit UrtB [Planctomycetota bacterium]|nr:urea ABC transporter permease subunit UrtB [Planctomycetota bacterium]
MPGLNKLFFFSCVLLALLSSWGCGGGDGGQAALDTGPVGQDLQDAISRLSSEDSDADARLAAVADFVKAGDLRAIAFLKSFREGQSIYRWKDRLVLVEKFDSDAEGNSSARLFDHILRTELNGDDGKQVVAAKSELKEVSASRGLRRPVLAAEDTLKLGARDEKTCQQAAQKCGNSRRAEFLLPLEALGADPSRSEKTRRVARTGVCLIKISGNVSLPEQEVLDAVRELGVLCSEAGVTALKKLSSKEDISPALAAECGSSIDAIESYQGKVRNLSHVFNGISAGSVLILMALGLSIIFGLMGVINMAHGELMMVGAYMTYVVMHLFGHTESTPANYYYIFAIPAAFLAAAFFGILIEFLVVRHLYGRPLDTLLATYACGLAMIQGARLIFGDNIGVNAPIQLVGSFELFQDFNIAWARLFIIFFCGFCVLLIYLLMGKTRMGLLIRATTQNRATARSLGVNSRFIDSMTFAFGSGLAGLAGCALTLIAGVTPDMGQNYIVDSFLVVVVGGVGELAGVVAAGLGIGVLNKAFEPFLGWLFPASTASVTWGKVVILVLVIAFIQWRPAGIFPPKGRLADV